MIPHLAGVWRGEVIDQRLRVRLRAQVSWPLGKLGVGRVVFYFSGCFPFSFLLGGGPAHCLSILFMELVPKLPLLPSSFHSFHPGPIISLGQESSPPAQLQAQTLYVDEDGTNSCLLNPAIALRSSITARTASVSLNSAKPRE